MPWASDSALSGISGLGPSAPDAGTAPISPGDLGVKFWICYDTDPNNRMGMSGDALEVSEPEDGQFNFHTSIENGVPNLDTDMWMNRLSDSAFNTTYHFTSFTLDVENLANVFYVQTEISSALGNTGRWYGAPIGDISGGDHTLVGFKPRITEGIQATSFFVSSLSQAGVINNTTGMRITEFTTGQPLGPTDESTSTFYVCLTRQPDEKLIIRDLDNEFVITFYNDGVTVYFESNTYTFPALVNTNPTCAYAIRFSTDTHILEVKSTDHPAWVQQEIDGGVPNVTVRVDTFSGDGTQVHMTDFAYTNSFQDDSTVAGGLAWYQQNRAGF
jgi:hypothetical protein